MYTAVAAFGNGGRRRPRVLSLQVQAFKPGCRLEGNVHSVRQWPDRPFAAGNRGKSDRRRSLWGGMV